MDSVYRERVFIVGHLRGERGREVFPITGVNSALNNKRIQKIGNIRKKGKSQSGDVFNTNGLAPTLCSTTTMKYPPKIAIPVLTPDRAEKRQNGRRFKKDGEEMFTLTAQDHHGIMIAGRLPGSHNQNSRVYSTEGIAQTLSTMQGGGQEQNIIQKARGYNEGGEHKIAPTLSANSWHENNILQDGYVIRKLTPR